LQHSMTPLLQSSPSTPPTPLLHFWSALRLARLPSVLPPPLPPLLEATSVRSLSTPALPCRTVCVECLCCFMCSLTLYFAFCLLPGATVNVPSSGSTVSLPSTEAVKHAVFKQVVVLVTSCRSPCTSLCLLQLTWIPQELKSFPVVVFDQYLDRVINPTGQCIQA
jgi:hypothetical protein